MYLFFIWILLCILKRNMKKNDDKMQQSTQTKGRKHISENFLHCLGNLVYSAPTSAGKTLVAEILMLKRVLDTKRKALYILPFVSVTREKMYSLRELYGEVDIKVGGFMGSDSPAGGLNAVDVAVCTIEKANSLINRLIEEKKISLLSCIVVDELHMIGDPGRGYLLELLLTKIRFVSAQLACEKEEENADQTVQLIGMSATLPNLHMLASWLGADLYLTDFRPVPLSEYVKVGPNIFDKMDNQVAKRENDTSVRGDSDGVIPLCIETIKEGNSVLIFCPTKDWCEKLGGTIGTFFSSNTQLLDEESSAFKKASSLLNEKSDIEDILVQLRNCPVGLEENLGKMVKFRVAYHHAGLTYDERDIIEGAFRRGILRVLVATSTLSSGVNLPAKRVIIRSPMFYGKVLDSLVYKQMSGRAGRKGIDTLGESIIVCKSTEKKNAMSLIQSDLRPVYSCLLDGGSSRSGYRTMKRALLEIICGGVAVTPEAVSQYEKMTFLHTCISELKDCDFNEAMGSTLEFLVDNEFITLQEEEDGKKRYNPTQLGSACLASSFSPDEALIAFSELQKARKKFVLENELHLIYQVTPIYLQDQWSDLDWYLYYNLWERLPQQYKDVGVMVGVEEGFLAKALRNRIQTRTEKQLETLRIHRRFYTALVLQELVNEVPIPVISMRYKINKGMLQTLQNASATFAGMLTLFCHKLGWTCLELLLDQFQSRLTFGVSRELCNLVRISLLSGAQARLLYDKGYETVSTVAFASQEDIASLLRESVPFESKKTTRKGAGKKETCRNIWLIGKEGLTEHEAAELIISEAQKVLRADAASLGLDVNSLETKRVKKTTPSRSSAKKRTPNSSGKRKKVKRNYLKNSTHSSSINSPVDKHSPSKKSSTHLNDKENQATPIGLRKETSRSGDKSLKNEKRQDQKLDWCLSMEKEKQSEGKCKISPANKHTLLCFDSQPEQEALLNDKGNQNNSIENLEIASTKKKCVVDNINKGDNYSSLEIGCKRNKKLDSILYKKTKEEMDISLSPIQKNNDNLDSKGINVRHDSKKKLTSKLPEHNNTPVVSENNYRTPLSPDNELDNSAEIFNRNVINPDTPLCNVNKNKKRSSSLLFSDPEFENCVDALTLKDTSNDYPKSDPKEHDKRSSSVVFSDTEFDMGILNVSSTPSVKTIPQPDPRYSDFVFPSSIGPTVPVQESDEEENLIHNDNNIETNSHSLSSGIEIRNICDKNELDNANTCTQFNLSNDSMFLLSNSLLQPISSANRGQPHTHLNLKENNQLTNTKPIDIEADVQLNLEDQFNEVFTEEKEDLVERSPTKIDINPLIKSNTKTINSLIKLDRNSAINDSSQDLFQDERSMDIDETQSDEFLIIDVASDKELFLTFQKEWSVKKRYSICFACERVQQSKDNSIGRNMRTNNLPRQNAKREFVYSTNEIAIVGLAVSWGGKDAYYVDLEVDSSTQQIDLNDTSLAPAVDKDLPIDIRLNVLETVFQNHSSNRSIIGYDIKDQLKIIHGMFGTLLDESVILDPKVAHWILAPSERGGNLHALVTEVLSEDYISILEAVGGEFGIKGLSEVPNARGISRMRACVEAVLVFNVMAGFDEKLKSDDLYQPFIEVEMPALRTLTVIEINGIGYSHIQSDRLRETMKAKLESIEKECYSLARRTFSMTSPDDVSRVLFIELGLPPNGVMDESPVRRNSRNKAGVKRKRYCTSKAVLEKLQKMHRLPKLILEWRRINNALTKVVYPLHRKKIEIEMLNMARIYSEPQYHTSTGRVMFSEPNLQNVPREFDIKIPVMIIDSPPEEKKRGRGLRTTLLSSSSEPPPRPKSNVQDPTSPGEICPISIRSIFIPFETGMFISADYCQLELRLIAHLSQDKKLIEVLNTAPDVFKGIAAKINLISIDRVDDMQRQQAKQICYGLIYGMGVKTLSEELNVSEEDAGAYMEQFEDRYSGIKRYIKETIDTTRKLGYVTTIGGRRRYLPAINSTNTYAKAQGERQSVNTAVQGSGADLVKKAMNSINDKIRKMFGSTCVNVKKKCKEQRGAFLVLQLHDELLYEVSRKDVKVVSEIIRTEMENVWKLAVKLPVRLKVGYNWGSLEEV